MIQATLLLLLVYCAARFLQKRSAAERHLLWVFAILVASLLPWLSPIMPAWRPEIAGRIASVLPGFSQAGPDRPSTRPGSAIVHAVGIEDAGLVDVVLPVVWIGGSLVALGLLAPGAVTLHRLISRSRAIQDPYWTNSASELKQALGLKQHVRLLQSEHGSLPLTWGIWRPHVLLPADALEWTESRRFSVLAHELAHIRRRDWLFQIVAEAACAVYWFHPLFWVARNRIHLESERACDDHVLGFGVEDHQYATHLLEIARTLKRRGPGWSLAMAGQLHLERRLVAILSAVTNRQSVTRKGMLVIASSLLCVVVPLTAVRGPDIADVDEAVDRDPDVVRYTLPPLYSDEARRRKVEGIVTVEAAIDATGRPRELHVLRGLGFGLDENALLAVRYWQFAPGRRTQRIARVDVEFSLETAELNDLIANDMVTNVGPDVIPPRIVRRVEARYPRGAAESERTGSVLLDAVIESDGIPRVVRVVRSLSWEVDEAAIAALEQWRFSPAQKDGTPVKVRMDVEMTFASPKP